MKKLLMNLMAVLLILTLLVGCGNQNTKKKKLSTNKPKVEKVIKRQPIKKSKQETEKINEKEAAKEDVKKENNKSSKANTVNSKEKQSSPKAVSNTEKNNKKGNISSSTHKHNWQPIYKTVHHNEEKENQVVGYDVYSECKTCGCHIHNNSEAVLHFDETQHGGLGSVHHDPIYQEVIVQQAYDEQIICGYKCSCGATK